MTLMLNGPKTKEIRIDFSKKRHDFAPVVLNGCIIDQVHHAKIFDVHISDDLKWNIHVENITCKASQRLHMIVLCKRAGMQLKDILTMYTRKIRPVIEYACPVWHPGLSNYLSEDLERIQMRALKIIVPDMSYANALVKCKLKHRRETVCKKLFCAMEKSDHKLHYLLPELNSHGRCLRHTSKYKQVKNKTLRTDGALVNWCLKHFLNDLLV